MRGLVRTAVLVCATSCGPSMDSELPESDVAPPRRQSARPVCPGKPLIAVDGVYCVLPEPRTFAAGSAACRASGMEVATIRSAEQNEALRSAMMATSATGGQTSVWFGLSDIESEGQWRWASGASVRSPMWAPGEPNDSGGSEDCGQLYLGTNTWNDLPCAAALPYVCQGAMAEGARYRCRGTPVAAGAKQYCVYAEARPWAEAKRACVDDGMTLAEFVTVGERADFATRMGAEPLPRNVWLGATDVRMEGRFEWVDGTPVRFLAFGSGEPNNSGGAENCVEWVGRDGRWNDLPCETSRATLCEVRGRATRRGN